MFLIMYLPTTLPPNTSVSSSTSGAIFFCGTVGTSRDRSPGGVKSAPSSVPASYAIKDPWRLYLNLPRLRPNTRTFDICTIQSGDGAIIATTEMNGCSQSTSTVTVTDSSGIVPPDADDKLFTPWLFICRAPSVLSSGALSPVSAIDLISEEA